MRKFKLIKKLPFEGSPDIGYISTEQLGEEGAHYWNHNWFHPEDYPEFWEEVKEFPKIISFRRTDTSKYIVSLTSRDEYNGWSLNGMLHTGECVNSGHFEIYQVAVSESEIFTLGDRVKYYGEVCNITRIYFNEHNQLSFKTNVKSLTVPKTGVFDLDVKYSKIKKAPEVLFVTEDGIEICEGDFHFSVNKKTLTLADNGTAQIGNSASHKDVWWTFSTKELAEKYIDENKPIYSKKQIEDTLINTFIGTSAGIAIFAEIFKRNLGL